jgi:hypothetical protein
VEADRDLVRDNLIVLMDGDALLGSGLLVRLRDGGTAILTARHVALDLVVAGELHVLGPQVLTS